VVPLRVFELRYRALVRDALRGERLIAMALLKPGWERDYYGSPEFFPLGCLGRIQEVEWLPNDCYDLKLAGLARVCFERMAREHPYRAAHVRIVAQGPLSDDDPLVVLERRALLEAFTRVARDLGSAAALSHSIALEPLVNHVCMSLAMDPASRQALLELDSLLERSRRVRERMERNFRQGHPPVPGDGEHN